MTNKHTPEVQDIPVNEVWDDSDNQDGLRPDNVTVNLLADGTLVESMELSEANDLQGVFKGKPVYANGQVINYTLTEDAVENYSVIIEGETITNSYTPEQTSVTVTKDWQDSQNQDGIRPESIEVTLTVNGVATGEQAVLSADNQWTTTWNGLPMYEAGEAIQYSVIETSIPEGYTTSVNDADQGNIILTNTYTPSVRTMTVNKLWDDADNQDGLRPEIVEVQLIANEDLVDEVIELNESNAWSYTWTDLPVNAQGETIDYRVVELNVADGYESSTYMEDDIVTLTNVHVPMMTEFPVTKIWDDGNNQDGLRPEMISVNLLANDEVVNTVELSEGNAWQYIFEDLPMYSNGQMIDYTITEDTVEHYTTVIEEGVIMNHYQPATMNIIGSKT